MHSGPLLCLNAPSIQLLLETLHLPKFATFEASWPMWPCMLLLLLRCLLAMMGTLGPVTDHDRVDHYLSVGEPSEGNLLPSGVGLMMLKLPRSLHGCIT